MPRYGFESHQCGKGVELDLLMTAYDAARKNKDALCQNAERKGLFECSTLQQRSDHPAARSPSAIAVQDAAAGEQPLIRRGKDRVNNLICSGIMHWLKMLNCGIQLQVEIFRDG